MKRTMLGIVSFVFAAQVFVCAGAECTWTGAGANTLWSNADNWKGGAAPTSSDSVVFPRIAAYDESGYTVTVEDAQAASSINIQDTANVALNRLSGVRFTGSGSLTIASMTTHRPFILDGLTITNKGDSNFKGDVYIKSGLLDTTAKKAVWFTKYLEYAPQLYVSGGTWNTYRLDMSGKDALGRATSRIHQTGGEVHVTTTFNHVQFDNFDISGGLFRFDGTLNWGDVYMNRDFYVGTNANIQAKYFKMECGRSSLDVGASVSRIHGSPTFIAGPSGWDSSSWGPYVYFMHGLTLKAYADWKNSNTRFGYQREHWTFDTADPDGGAPHSITRLGNMFFLTDRMHLIVKGGGSVEASGNLSTKAANTYSDTGEPAWLGSLRIEDGSAFNFVSSNLNYTISLRTRDFHLDAGSKLELMGFAQFVKAWHSTFEKGSMIDFYLKGGSFKNGSYPLVSAGPTSSVENVTINLTGTVPANYQVVKRGNHALLWDGADLPPPSSSNEYWKGGASDNKFTNPENWWSGTYSAAKGRTVKLNYSRHQMIENDGSDTFFRIEQGSYNWGTTFTGKKMTLTSNNFGGSYSAVNNSSHYPLVFDCPVDTTSKGGIAFMGAYSGTNGGGPYAAFMQGVDIPTTLGVAGIVLFGGTSYVKEVWLIEDKDEGATLALLPGASMTVTNQMLQCYRNGNSLIYNVNSNQSFYAHARMVVEKGATLRFTHTTGDERMLTQNKHVNTVDGTLKIDIPFIVTAKDQSFAGKGRVELAKPTINADTAAKICISEQVKLYPSNWWKTAVAAYPAKVLPLAIETHATLGALDDWTYGPEAGFTPETSAASRAIQVATNETLWVDTENPDTKAAQTITFADPVVAPYGFLVKRGAGTLVLKSTANDLSTTEVSVEKGVLALVADQTFGTLRVANGGSLAFDSLDRTVEVSGDAVINGTIGFVGDVSKTAIAWQPLVTVPAGRRILGNPVAAKGQRVRVVTNDDGSMSLTCRAVRGTMAVIY